jgi:hypothetical protein
VTIEWFKIKAGSYMTEDGWNAWRRSDGKWNVRSPRGEYHLTDTYTAARSLVAKATR